MINKMVHSRLETMMTFGELRHTARLQPEGGLPFLGCPSAAVLLILGAAELTLPLRLLAAVRAHADHTLLPHQKLASVPVAHHNHLVGKEAISLICDLYLWGNTIMSVCVVVVSIAVLMT